MMSLTKLILRENKEKFQEAANEHRVIVTFEKYRDDRLIKVTAQQFTHHSTWENMIYAYQRKNPALSPSPIREAIAANQKEKP